MSAEAHDRRRQAERSWRDLSEWAQEMALAVHEGDSALNVLADITSARQWLEHAEGETVAYARAAGATWAEIGAALGITRQSAHERYSR